MTWTDGDGKDRRGVPIGDRLLRRGVDTSVGQRGRCDACGVTMPDGPDACLGYLPGVSHACCGHGGVTEAYVVIGGEPDQPCWEIRGAITLRGALAREYIAQARR